MAADVAPPFRRIDGLLTLGIERYEHVVLVLGQIAGPERQAAPGIGAVALRRDAALRADGPAGELLARDDVDHAGHRIRAVHGRGARFQDVDPVHDVHRNLVQVDEGVLAVVGETVYRQAAAVEQHQSVVQAQAAQRNTGCAGGEADSRPRIGQVAVVGGGDLADDFGYRIEARGFDVRAADRLDRRRRFAFDFPDVGAGYVDLDVLCSHGTDCEQRDTADTQCNRKPLALKIHFQPPPIFEARNPHSNCDLPSPCDGTPRWQ